MSKTRHFWNQHQTSYDSLDQFAEDCYTVLGFMHDYRIPSNKDEYGIVEGLHNGTHEEMDWWREHRSRSEWLSSLQSIKVLPTYEVLEEFKGKIEEIIHEWIVNR